MKTRRSRYAPTAIQLLKARCDEARAIKEAWDDRLRRAEADHTKAAREGGDTAATQRRIEAAEVGVTDAAGELRVALHAWTTACINHQPNTNTWRHK